MPLRRCWRASASRWPWTGQAYRRACSSTCISALIRRAGFCAAAGSFTSLGLELGGKDPAYVREDANLDHAIENLVDGAFFNSGQCCCGIERIYVHERHYDRFVEGAVDLVNKYVLGNPVDETTTLGPMAHK